MTSHPAKNFMVARDGVGYPAPTPRTGSTIVTKMTWKTEPDPHDYPAAASYLSLIATPEQINDLIDQLKTAPLSHYKAKDMLLTHGIPLQIADGYHRVCASYHLDENTDIPCRITTHPHHT
jgi:hypothetical protein